MVVFVVLHPPIDPAEIQEFIEKVADNVGGRWEGVQLIRAFGLTALLLGFLGVYRSITTGTAAIWARLGFYGVIVTTAFWMAHTAVELGFSPLLEDWKEATGTDKQTLFLVDFSLRQVNLGLIVIAAFVYSLTLIAFGLGMSLSGVYPRWFGWIIVILGVPLLVLSVAVGLTLNLAIAFPMLILTLLSYVWALIPGIWLIRKAWWTGTAPASTPEAG